MLPVVAIQRIGIALLAVGLTASNPVAVNLPSAGPVPRPAAASTADPAPFRSVRTYTGVAVPVRLRIPSQKIDTPLRRLGLAADGTIAAPREWQVAGWYDRGPRPGQNGPAVVVGHIDSRAGPAVFFRLPDLMRGAAVYVDRKDGSTVRFRVAGRRQVAKDRFPATAVYSPSLQPSLVLITCGGTFDRSAGHYRDNIIVTAVPG
ncbi:MAG TPA: class F sortase [Kineosporiaceae bacterium]|nr:class F sortase [Kineosporiaceae bacterium]